MLNASFNISYEYGGKAILDESWNRYGYCLSENKIFYILSGELVIRVRGVEHVCKEGDLVLIPAQIVHDFYVRNNISCTKYWFHFSVLQGNKQVTQLYDLPVRLSCGDEKIKRLFASAIKPVQNTTDALRRASTISSVLAYYIDSSKASKRTENEDGIDQAVKFINENLNTRFTLSELSSKFYLSTGYFVRKFHKKTGLSPMKYLLLARIYEAKRLLSETNKPVSEIMESVGILDAAYFSKIFKSATGFSPRFFRKMTKNS